MANTTLQARTRGRLLLSELGQTEGIPKNKQVRENAWRLPFGEPTEAPRQGEGLNGDPESAPRRPARRSPRTAQPPHEDGSPHVAGGAPPAGQDHQGRLLPAR